MAAFGVMSQNMIGAPALSPSPAEPLKPVLSAIPQQLNFKLRTTNEPQAEHRYCYPRKCGFKIIIFLKFTSFPGLNGFALNV